MEPDKSCSKIKKRKLNECDDSIENESERKKRKLNAKDIHCRLETLLKTNKSLMKENKLIRNNKLTKHYKKGMDLYKKEANKWKSEFMKLYSQISVITNTNNKESISLHSYNINFDNNSHNIIKYKSKNSHSNNKQSLIVNKSYKKRSKKSLYKEPNKSKKRVIDNNENNNTLQLQSKTCGNNNENNAKTCSKCNNGLKYYSINDLIETFGKGICDNKNCKLPLCNGGYHCTKCDSHICKKCGKDVNDNINTNNIVHKSIVEKYTAVRKRFSHDIEFKLL